MKFINLFKNIKLTRQNIQALFRISIIFIMFVCLSCSNNVHPESKNADSIQSNADSSGFLESLQKNAAEAYDNKDYKEALKYYNLLLQKDSLNGVYYFRRGYCLDYLEQTEKAIICYNKAITLDSSDSQSHLNLSLIYTQHLQDSLALFHVNEYLKIKPLNPKGLQLKSLILKIAQDNKQKSSRNKP